MMLVGEQEILRFCIMMSDYYYSYYSSTSSRTWLVRGTTDYCTVRTGGTGDTDSQPVATVLRLLLLPTVQSSVAFQNPL